MHTTCCIVVPLSPIKEKPHVLWGCYKISPILESQNSPMSLCGATFLPKMRLTDAAKMMRHRTSWGVLGTSRELGWA